MKTRARHSWSALLTLILTLVVAAVLAPRAVACTIDGRPSMAVDGVHAARNPVAPTGVGVWAPFVVNTAFVSGAAVQVTEIGAYLRRTLSSGALAAPFRWNLGDGSHAVGHTITHRYRQPGLYQVEVYALNTRTHSWFPFDRVLLRISRTNLFAGAGHAPGKPGLLAHSPFTTVGGSLLAITLALLAAVRRWGPIQRHRGSQGGPTVEGDVHGWA